MITNFATRAHNHNFGMDPIVRSLLDLDFYKVLMCQFIWKKYSSVEVTFKLMNRTKKVRMGDQVDIEELRAQLDYVRGLKFQRTELVWLAGETFYGKRAIFEQGFIDFLRDFQLPEYSLEVEDGQFVLTFTGPWAEVTLWEIYALSIVNELRNRAAMKSMSEFDLDIMYANAKARLWSKIEKLKKVDGLKLADFGTRRRHSFLWQEYVVTAMQAELGEAFTGTSNTSIAFKHNLEAIGTNAHELPMVLTAIAHLASQLDKSEEAVRKEWEDLYGPVLASGDMKGAQYEVLRQWSNVYGGALRVMLPDTYGTTQFLEDAPEIAEEFTGKRVDSKDPEEAGDEYIAWLRGRGIDPKTKLLLFSDGLDVDDIVYLHGNFKHYVRIGFGWGTLLTNDFRECHPRGLFDLEPISLVCKVTGIALPFGGDPTYARAGTVKLSDNYTKATGTKDDVDAYRKIFGTKGVKDAPVTV